MELPLPHGRLAACVFAMLLARTHMHFTCPGTYASCYVAQSTREGRAVAEQAETKKNTKYYIIVRAHHFVPMAVDTSGAFGPAAIELFTDIAKCIWTVTQEVKSRAYLF